MSEQEFISIRHFRESDLESIRKLIHHTIDVSYSPVYPPRALQFFKDFHTEDKIIERHQKGDIFVMEKDHAERIKDLWPDAAQKIELLGKYIAADSSIDDIVDPYGRSSYHYRLAQSQLTLAVNNIVQALDQA